jgi:hypothetical protein
VSSIKSRCRTSIVDRARVIGEPASNDESRPFARVSRARVVVVTTRATATMSDDEHDVETFESADAGASHTVPMQAGSVRKGGFMVRATTTTRTALRCDSGDRATAGAMTRARRRAKMRRRKE